MREIKFRVWNNFGKCWVRGGDVYLDLDDSSIVEYGYDGLSGTVDGEYAIQQFTGLKDKNGHEIYEGDIVVSDVHEKKETYVVKYREDWEDFGGTFWSGFRFWNVDKFVEVIGNVFENSDLLK